jgi:sugar transferase EpsL
MKYVFSKRLFDLSLTGFGLVVLLPVLGILALLVLVFHGAPVLFTQERPGRDGKHFRMLKFRSMTSTRDDLGVLLPDAQRLTPFGQFLRSSSLDELPGLWNVLRGEMSLVGPRPLLVEYLDRYTTVQARRHEVRPGITGWAQVNGRNAISWEQKFEFDVWYVDHQTFLLDLRILWMTAMKVLKRDGINAAGDATMPKFKGSPRDM